MTSDIIEKLKEEATQDMGYHSPDYWMDKAVLAERKRLVDIVKRFKPDKPHWANEALEDFLETMIKTFNQQDNKKQEALEAMQEHEDYKNNEHAKNFEENTQDEPT